MIRVGYLPYLNAAPFYWTRNTWDVELVPSVPSEFGQLAADGKVDAGIMSVQDWFLQESEFEPLGKYGICSFYKAQSVLLFSHKPITELEDEVIGVTQETSTSVKLLQLLLEQKYKVRPRDYQHETKGIAWLLIGDNALREKKESKMPYVYDLGEEWMRWQNLPFVFAFWVVRRSLEIHHKKFLLDLVCNSFAQSMVNLKQVAEYLANDSILSADEICTYLSNFNYLIGNQEELGLLKFRALIEKLK